MPKSKNSFIGRNWKVIVNAITLIALGILIYAIRHQIIATVDNLSRVDVWFLVLMVPLQVANYHAQTRVYQCLFALVGNRLHYMSVLRVTLELNFVNHVFPSGGVSGISYFGLRMKSAEITGGKATVIQFLKLLLLFMSFELLLIAGLIFMAIGGRANNLVVLASGSLSTLLIIGTFAFVLILGSEKRIHVAFTAVTIFLNRVLHFFFRHSPETIEMARIERAALELHKNYKLVEQNYRDLTVPFFWSFVANLTEVMTIYVVYMAFGKWVNLGAVILAYAVANFAGAVSVLPGGIGIYEALMTGVLAAAGIPAALSLPVTVMYRVISPIIQLPPGYVLYHKSLRQLQSSNTITGG